MLSVFHRPYHAAGSLIFVTVCGPSRHAVFAQVYVAGHFVAIHSAAECKKQSRALNLLRAAEVHLIGRYTAAEIARHIFAPVGADELSTILLENKRVNRTAAIKVQRGFPLPRDGYGFALGARWILKFRRLRKDC